MLLLFEVGLETDLEELGRVGAPALAVALAGMVLPFAGGYAIARAFDHPVLTATFIGAALTATSIGITARVLSELKVLATREGQIILGAAVADDVLGLVVLAVVSKIAGGGTLDAATVAKSTGLAIGFLVAGARPRDSARPPPDPRGRARPRPRRARRDVGGVRPARRLAREGGGVGADRRAPSPREWRSRGPIAATTSTPRSSRSSTSSRRSSSSTSGRKWTCAGSTRRSRRTGRRSSSVCS